MTPNSTDPFHDWRRFREHLADGAVADSAAPARPAELAPGVLYVDTRPVPQGFSDLTQMMTEKGVPLAPGVRVGVEPNSVMSRTLCEALFVLAPDTPLGRHLCTGDDVEVVQALLTLFSKGVVEESALVALIAQACGAPADALSSNLPHALAQVGVEPGEAGLSLVERFEMLRQIGCSPMRADAQGLSAIHHAAAQGNLPALAALRALRCPMHRANERGLTPLHLAAGHRQAASLRFLLSELPASSGSGSSGRGSASLTEWLATEKGSAENPDALGRSAMHMLCSYAGGRTDVQAFVDSANVLLEAGAGLQVKDFRGRTPLEVAVRLGNASHIAGMRAAGLLGNPIECQRLLINALRCGNRAAASEFLRGGDAAFRHQAVLAVARMSSEVLRELCALPGRLLEAPDAAGRSPVQALATQIGDWVTLERITDARHVREALAALLRLAAAGAELPDALRQKLIVSAVSFDSFARGDRDQSAIGQLSRAGLMQQPDPSVQDMMRNVLRAAESRPELRPTLLGRIYNLLHAGAQIANPMARRVIRLAAVDRNVEFLRDAHRFGLFIDAPGEKGMSPLQDFVARNKIGPVKTLLQVGANINHMMETGDTALHIAAGSGFVPMVELLVKAGARSDLKNTEGKTARDYALSVDHPKETKKALKTLLPPAPSSGLLARMFQRPPPRGADADWTVVQMPANPSTSRIAAANTTTVRLPSRE